MRARARRGSSWLALVLLAATSLGLGANSLEYRVKAAYLYNFFLFVDWPKQAFKTNGDDFELCILGRDPFGTSLRSVAQKTAQQRPINLRHLNSVEPAGDCHVLYISRSEDARVAGILRSLRGSPVLTVSEKEGFVEQGGTVGFTLKGGKVRLEVNLATARQSGLRISSKLLEVAAVVQR
jgi:hypothetical protein